MIHKEININDWCADIFFCVKHYNESVLEDALKKVGAPIGVIVRMRQIARDDEYNTGFTYSSSRLRKSVMVIGKTTDASEFIDSFVHEVRHLADDIALADGVNVRGETVAYLEGDIAKTLYPAVAKFMCPCCRKKAIKVG